MKKCSKCKELKEDFEFAKDKSQKSGLTCQCKECRNSIKIEKRKVDVMFRQREKNYKIKRKNNKIKMEEDRKVRLERYKKVNFAKYHSKYRIENKEKINKRRKTFEIGEYVMFNGNKYKVIDIKHMKGLLLFGNNIKIRIAKYRVKRFIKKYNY